MKVCKKCKKHVANKTKICKFCGADVSKCKIIKSSNVQNKKIELNKNGNLNKSNVLLKTDIVDSTVNEFDNKKDVKKDKKLKSKSNKDNSVKKANIKNKSKVKNKNRTKSVRSKRKLSIKKFLNYKLFNFIKIKFVLMVLIIICCVCLIISIAFKDNNSYFETKKENEVFLDSNKDNLYEMGEVINYKGVKYKVIGVETSFGNSYKEPKDGNQFLIVTISIFNDTDDKIEYSYNNWTMSNSESKEDAKRIFTSINVDTALYSGKLVVGGLKKGSMVFEQPIDNDDIRLNFYELIKGEDDTVTIDKDKKVFSVKIDVPKTDDENKTDDKK